MCGAREAGFGKRHVQHLLAGGARRPALTGGVNRTHCLGLAGSPRRRRFHTRPADRRLRERSARNPRVGGIRPARRRTPARRLRRHTDRPFLRRDDSASSSGRACTSPDLRVDMHRKASLLSVRQTRGSPVAACGRQMEPVVCEVTLNPPRRNHVAMPTHFVQSPCT
jgi:hypothetical protein